MESKFAVELPRSFQALRDARLDKSREELAKVRVELAQIREELEEARETIITQADSIRLAELTIQQERQTIRDICEKNGIKHGMYTTPAGMEIYDAGTLRMRQGLLDEEARAEGPAPYMTEAFIGSATATATATAARVSMTDVEERALAGAGIAILGSVGTLHIHHYGSAEEFFECGGEEFHAPD